MRRSSNYRRALWLDIASNIERRIEENKLLARRIPDDPDVHAAMRRIANDDRERLIDARKWADWHA